MSTVRNARVRPDLLYVASGWNTLITDVHGRITGQGPQGLFIDNTRVLCREHLTLDEREPVAFSTVTVGAHAQLSYAQIRDGDTLPPRNAYLILERFLGEGLRTRITVASFAYEALHLELCAELDADFADTDEAESERRLEEDVDATWDPDGRELRLRWVHPALDRVVAIRVEGAPGVRYAERAIAIGLDIAPRGTESIELVVEPIFDGRRRRAPCAGYDEPHDSAARSRQRLAGELARLRSTNLAVAAAWRTATADLAMMALGEEPGPAAPFAGLPLYQQIFGRDSLTVSWQALLAGPTMLRDSLRLNAAHVGRRIDDWHDEEPGKLLHQARRGPLSLLGDNPFDHYYGDWATPPDFLIFLGQYYAWTGDLDTVRTLLPVARQVVAWLERYGDADRDGFLEYQCRSRRGVKNQGWKDSDSAIVDEHGTPIDNPIAASELQGYWYAALRHGALAFGAAGDRAFALSLARRASTLRRRFDASFWMPEHGCYAMALGPDKQQVRSVNSNDGHLLATGIVPIHHAAMVVRRLMAPDMFSGWGLRTLSSEHPAYDPFSYHRGSVWPVEIGTAAVGFARYGCWTELHRLAEGAFAAAAMFEGHRLPEVLGGFPRDDTHPYPGIYPRSCSPQAWSASAIISVVLALLALRPVAPLRSIVVDPHLPEWLPDLTLEAVQVGTATFDLELRRSARGRVRVRTQGDRVAVLRAPTWQSRAVRANDRIGAT